MVKEKDVLKSAMNPDTNVCNLPPTAWFMVLSFALLFIFTFLVFFAMGYQICIIGVAIGVIILIAYILQMGECAFKRFKR